MTRFFEDLAVGETREFGDETPTREEILEFAERYDPQPFHTDEEAAAESIYGGLIASGWHTVSLGMRMLVREYWSDVSSLGARGVDELRFRRPVRPGDALSVRTEILEKSDDTSPERGLVRLRIEGVNGDETVVSMVALMLVERREAARE